MRNPTVTPFETQRDCQARGSAFRSPRRKRLLAAGVAALLAVSLAASSSSADESTPHRGGTLTVGMTGGTAADTLDGQGALQPTDWARAYALYDPLVRLNNAGVPELWLAKSITPNDDATEWTIAIPGGIKTHKGGDFTAEDVLYSLKRIVDTNSPAAAVLGPIDIANSKVVDGTTVLVKYKSPFATFIEGLSQVNAVMVPRDFDPKNPDGTGPFVYDSFTPAQSSTFTRNDHYWRGDGAYLDTLVIQNINDEQSQLAALQSGQVDLIPSVSNTTIQALQGQSEFKTYETASGACFQFTMRSDVPPFNDPNVRQAFKLMVDRKQMLTSLFGGAGSEGNDVFGKTDPMTDTSIPQREQDIEGAKELLAKAGMSGMKVDLYTAEFGPYLPAAAQVLATQAKAAGVNINVIVQDPTEFFEKSALKVPFTMDWYGALPYLTSVSLALIGDVSPYNMSHYNDPEFTALYKKAIATVDEKARAEIIHKMQRMQYDSGSLIIPACYPSIDASTARVHGMEATKSGLNPNSLDFADIWVD